MDLKELKERQSWSLSQKIDHSLGVIDQFYGRLDGKVYVSFSGGKDSTVLLWLARKIFPDIKAVFCNTGNEYPDIVKFVRSTPNIEIIYPKLKPREVVEKHGFPVISKETSEFISSVQRNPNSLQARRGLGLLTKEEISKSKYKGEIPKKWRNLICQFAISDKCCYELKKNPFRRFEKKYKLKPILGVMASESSLRSSDYIKRGGCNVFRENGLINSHPLSIWLEQDIWNVIEKYDIPISDIYKKGASRTGCMFCGYGCQFKNDNRLQLVYDMYPKMYNMFINYENNGVTYREALRKVLAVNKLYLPDERPLDLFSYMDLKD